MANTSFNGSAKPLPVNTTKPFVYADTAAAKAAKLQASQHSEQTTSTSSDASGIDQRTLSRLITEARAEGAREEAQRARESFEQELARIRQQSLDSIAAFQQERKEYFAKVEVELVHFALAIAAKVLHREAQVDRMVVAGLVKVMLEKIEQGTKVSVRVRPEEAGGWRDYFRDNSNLQVLEDSSLAPRGCLLQSELGIADLGLESQLKELEKGFFDLLAQRPESR